MSISSVNRQPPLPNQPHESPPTNSPNFTSLFEVLTEESGNQNHSQSPLPEGYNDPLATENPPPSTNRIISTNSLDNSTNSTNPTSPNLQFDASINPLSRLFFNLDGTDPRLSVDPRLTRGPNRTPPPTINRTDSEKCCPIS